MLLLAALLATAAPACEHDRGALLALSADRFDQDMTGGWRKLADAGCEREAAALIRDWHAAHRKKGAAVPWQADGLLYWHEGQLRANVGETRRAIALFERARKTPADDAGFGWNLYVDGSIAFLRRDRAGLERARAALAALPRPADYAPRRPDGSLAEVRWPMNLDVLDGFRRCWDQPYKAAYSCGLR